MIHYQFIFVLKKTAYVRKEGIADIQIRGVNLAPERSGDPGNWRRKGPGSSPGPRLALDALSADKRLTSLDVGSGK